MTGRQMLFHAIGFGNLLKGAAWMARLAAGIFITLTTRRGVFVLLVKAVTGSWFTRIAAVQG